MKFIFRMAALFGHLPCLGPINVKAHGYRGRGGGRPFPLPRRDQKAAFFQSEKPLSKRAKRRARGKAKAS